MNPAISFTFFPPQSILSMLLPLLDRLLEQSGPDRPALLRTEAQLVSLLLGKYNEAAAPLLAKDQKCLDLFVRVLGSSTQQFSDAHNYQICALEQVSGQRAVTAVTLQFHHSLPNT